ncbi:MAG: vgr related protein [Pontixanthobacter sp.]
MASAQSCPAEGERGLTDGEIALARSVFGTAIDYEPVRLRRRKWFAFHPRNVTMAPRGHMHFHPDGPNYCDDFSTAALSKQGHFIHEMTHVWQAQEKGSWWLVFNRVPWARYDYTIQPGWPLNRYGIEQQAEIVRHAFVTRNGGMIAGIGDARVFDRLVRFPGAGR